MIATFFDGLLTKDGDAREAYAYEDLKMSLATPPHEGMKYYKTVLDGAK